MPKKKVAFKKPNLSRVNKKIILKKPSKQAGMIWGAAILAVVLFGVSGYFWWTRIFTDADRVFADMLANNLSSSSVTRRVVQQDQSSSIDQTVFLSFRAPEVVSQTRTVLSEKGPTRQTTTVTTETIGTKNDDFVRYVSAEGAETLSVAGNLDEVLGVWGQRSADGELGDAVNFLNEAAFSVVPFGSLPKDQRSELLDFIEEKRVYEYTQADRAFVDGRYSYAYVVSIDPVALVETLAKYAEITGIGDSSQLNPASYEGAAPVNLRMTVDILSRQLRSIEYLATGRTETIESRGIYHEIVFPEQAIPFQELQNRLLGQGSSATSGEHEHEGGGETHSHEDGTTHSH